MLKNKISVEYKDWLSDGYFDVEIKPMENTLDISTVYNLEEQTFNKHIVVNNIDMDNIYDILYKYLKDDILVVLGLENKEMDQVIDAIVDGMTTDYIEDLSYTILVHKNHPVELKFLQW